MITAVVYTSNTGETEKYARCFAEKVNLPCMDLKHADTLDKGTQIIYFGWIIADTVQGYDNAEKKYVIPCVCGVGISASGTKHEEVRKATGIPESVQLFTLQGGLHMEKLRGMHRLILSVVRKSSIRKLEEKQRNPQEEDDLDLWRNGGSRFDETALDPVIRWYRESGQIRGGRAPHILYL